VQKAIAAMLERIATKMSRCQNEGASLTIKTSVETPAHAWCHTNIGTTRRECKVPEVEA
jgi:hypothetical protein